MFFYERPKIQEVFEYRRQSLDEKDVRQTHSLPLQAQFNAEFADRFDLKIVDTFVDDASAKIPNNRPAFTAMLRELKNKTPKARRARGILAWHPDRLARNGLEAGQIVQMVVDDQIEDMKFPTYHFHNDPSGIEHLMMEFGRAISYSGWLSINSKRGSTGRERQGAWVYGRSKFGYTKLRECPEHPKRCSLFPIPDERTFPARQRLVELWLKGVTDEECSKVLKREFGITLKRPSISEIRRDPFNYGVYVIKPGTDDERQVDFRELSAPDGTKFEPVTDEATYWSFQSQQRKLQPRKTRSKHTNPLPNVVTCGACSERMRPARRKIHRKGGVKIDQLGFECHNAECKAGRVKADLLFDKIASEIQERFSAVGKREYHQYLVGLRSFSAEQIKTTKVQRTRLSKRLKSLEGEKATVVERRLGAINAYEYDDETKTWCQRRLKELNRDIGDVKTELAKIGEDGQTRIRSFKEIIELKENLHRYWLAANDDQKQMLCEKLVLNLEVKDKKTRSITWKKPLCDWPKIPEKGCGGVKHPLVELFFPPLWASIFENGEKGQIEDLLFLARKLKRELPECIKFRIPIEEKRRKK